MRFYTEGFLSKWGFQDGDIIDDLLWDAGYDKVENFAFGVEDEIGPVYGFEHTVLGFVLLEEVLPALDQQVAVSFIGTIHNPVRASAINGKDLPAGTWFEETPEGMITPEWVDVTDEAILRLARSIAGW